MEKIKIEASGNSRSGLWTKISGPLAQFPNFLSWPLSNRQFWAYFAVAAVVVVSFGSAALLINQHGPKVQAELVATAQAEPQVLGAATDIRGQPAPQPTPTPAYFVQIGQPDFSQVTARSFLVYDFDSGQVLASQNPDSRLPIASLTKLITGLVAYDHLALDSTLTIDSGDVFDVSPILNLKVGDQVKVSEVFKAMLVGSANDAARTLANHVADETGQNFVELMNAKAQALGMLHSQFSNPLGFDLGKNYSTADDLRLAIAAAERLPIFSGIGRNLNYAFGGSLGRTYRIQSTNQLLKTHPEISAIKTGYTDNSKGSMIVKINDSGRSLIMIVLGSDDREQDVLRLEAQILSSFAPSKE